MTDKLREPEGYFVSAVLRSSVLIDCHDNPQYMAVF